MSSVHVRLRKVFGGWLLEDARSKNGTYLNGERCERAELTDGDVIGLGNTFWVFRSDVLQERDEPLDLESAGFADRPAVLTTLNPELARTFERLERIASSDLPILLTGETGTGKEMTARAIHTLAGRQGPFAAINFGALTTTLVESELFGVEKGAFTGAGDARLGHIRAAHRGTLLLDEIAELPESAQPALLRVLQEREVVPVGGVKPIPVDVRLVATTHRDLRGLVEAGKFRADLYARLNGYHVVLPPLRERPEDLGLLIAHLLSPIAAHRQPGLRIARDAAHALFGHRWPFNIRELQQALAAAVAVTNGDEITLDALPPEISVGGTDREPTPARQAAPDLPRAPDALEKELTEQMRLHRGNVAAVARSMETSRSQVRRLARRYGIEPSAFRDPA
jgi:DNA-binding NtrC family response regulator